MSHGIPDLLPCSASGNSALAPYSMNGNTYVTLCHCGLYSDSRMPHACLHADASASVQACYSVAQWRRINNRVTLPRLAEAERLHASTLASASVASWQAPTYSLAEADARILGICSASAARRAEAQRWSPLASMLYGAVSALRRWRWHTLDLP